MHDFDPVVAHQIAVSGSERDKRGFIRLAGFVKLTSGFNGLAVLGVPCKGTVRSTIQKLGAGSTLKADPLGSVVFWVHNRV